MPARAERFHLEGAPMKMKHICWAQKYNSYLNLGHWWIDNTLLSSLEFVNLEEAQMHIHTSCHSATLISKLALQYCT